MQALRPLLLLFSIALLVIVGAASLSPAPDEAPPDPPPASAPRVADPGPKDPGAPLEIRFEAEITPPFRAGAQPEPVETETVRAGERVLVEVAASTRGEVALDGLGQTAFVEPGTPARFDLVPATGRYEVLFTTANGADEPIGTLIVKPAAEPSVTQPAT